MRPPKNAAPLDEEDVFRRTLRNRLARAGGHLRSVERMVEQGADLGSIAVQIAAVKAALDGVSKAALRRTLERQADALRRGDETAFAELQKIVAQFLK